MLIVTGGTGPAGDLASTEVDLLILGTLMMTMPLITIKMMMMMVLTTKVTISPLQVMWKSGEGGWREVTS